MTNILNVLLTAVIALLCITVHEFSHGYCSYLMGDDTAKNAGRLTLNPIKHLDPIGFVCLIIAHIGWAKPVPINPYKFKNRKLGLILVSLAGPLSNFIFAFLLSALLPLSSYGSMFQTILILGIVINVGLGVFNLIPIPPLDGSKIVLGFLPSRYEASYEKIQPYMMGLVMLLAITGLLSSFISPIIDSITYFLIGIFV